jgi:hypothetical protein
VQPQVAICKAALLWLLLVCRCEDVSAEVRRLTASILSNLSRQPLNRSRFYRAELAKKRDDAMQLQAADGASRRKVFFGPKRWTPTGGELDGDDDEEEAMEFEEEEVEEEEAAAEEESSELGELPPIGELESLHSGSQAGSRVGSQMGSRKGSLRPIVHSEQEAAVASGSRRVSAMHSEESGSAMPGSRRVSMQRGDASVRRSVHDADVSTSAKAMGGGGEGGDRKAQRQREKRGKLRQRFMQFSESVEAERVEGQEELQWLTVGGLPADVSSTWVQQRQSLQSEERPEWVARLQPEVAAAVSARASRAPAAAGSPQKRGGLAPLGQNLRRPLRDIWKHDEDEEPLQASPWQPDIVLIQTRADSQRRRRRRPAAKRVPSLDVVVGTGGDRNVIHFRDKGRKKLLFNPNAPQVPRLDMFEHAEGCTLCRLMGFEHFVLPDGKVRIQRHHHPVMLYCMDP